MYKPVFVKISQEIRCLKKKALIEIKTGYTTIDKQYTEFSLRQKRISTVAILVEDDTQTICKAYIQIYLQLLDTLVENFFKFCVHN